MRKEKVDLITEREFNKINLPKKKKHRNLPSESIPEDENNDSYIETLIGMEYDSEPVEEIEKIDNDEEE